MKNRIRQLIRAGVGLVLSVQIFVGCSPDEEWIPFSGEGGPVSADLQSDPVQNSQAEEGVKDLQKEEETGEWIVVYVCGAVEFPGVYTLKGSCRVNDAVNAAGGFSQEASETSVNLASRAEDGDMIYIPTKEEAAGTESNLTSGNRSGESKLVDINRADVAELCTLPGIGETKACEIVAYREKNGAFRKKEDIMKVSGIKKSLYEKIADMIFVE